MDVAVREGLSATGDTKHTKVGIDVVCRVGDPSNVHDLLRVGANRCVLCCARPASRPASAAGRIAINTPLATWRTHVAARS